MLLSIFCSGTISTHSINTLYHLCASVPPIVASKGSAVLSTSLAPCASLPFPVSPGRSLPARCALQNASPLSHLQRTSTRQSIHTACQLQYVCVFKIVWILKSICLKQSQHETIRNPFYFNLRYFQGYVMGAKCRAWYHPLGIDYIMVICTRIGTELYFDEKLCRKTLWGIKYTNGTCKENTVTSFLQ